MTRPSVRPGDEIARRRAQSLGDDRFEVPIHLRGMAFIRLVVWARRRDISISDTREVADALGLTKQDLLDYVHYNLKYFLKERATEG